MRQRLYKIRISDELAGLVRRLHPQLKRKVKASLKTILSTPDEGKTLKGELAELRSYRVGQLRIIYRVVGKNVVEIVAIGPREKIYEETFLILKKEAR